MNNFSGKILMLAFVALLLQSSVAFAGPSADWNNSWGFPTPFEKANALEQALAIELVEEDGFNNESTYFGTNDTYIGNGGTYIGTGGTGIWQIDNSINDSVLDSFNTQDSFNKTKTTTNTTTTNQTTTNSNNTTNTTNK